MDAWKTWGGRCRLPAGISPSGPRAAAARGDRSWSRSRRPSGRRHALETQRPFRNILVAVDGSDHAFDAVRVASRLAAALSAKLTLMTAYHAPSDALGEPNYSRALGDALTEAQR